MIRVGLLGAGGMGNVHARHYRNVPGVEVLFWDYDAERRDAFQKRWQLDCGASLEDVIARTDALDVCLPTDLHVEMARRAIAAGRAVLIEKPAAGSFEDALALYREAEDAGVPYMVGHVVRFFPEYAAAHDAVVGGSIGRPGVARLRRGGLAPTGSGSWFMDHSRSGGVLLDLAIHDFDWLRWTLGEVTLVNARSLGAHTGTGPDYGLTVLTFASGAIAHVESTWMDPGGSRMTFEVCGSDGMIEWDSRMAPSLRTHLPGKTFNEAPLASHDDPYFNELSAFVRYAQNGGPAPVSGLDGALAVGIARTALESARAGKPLKPPS
jgi:myo-inositol 2-dehydrogenase/D-chiro-inositol 1-dehydrogenase